MSTDSMSQGDSAISTGNPEEPSIQPQAGSEGPDSIQASTSLASSEIKDALDSPDHAYKLLLSLDDRKKVEELRSLSIDINLKEMYATDFILIVKWILVGTFFTCWCAGVRLFVFDRNELSILIYGSFLEVFGIVFVITNYLFYRPGASLYGNPLADNAKRRAQVLFKKNNDSTG